MPCPKCGHPAEVRQGRPTHWPPSPRTEHMIHLRCDRCEITPNAALAGLALALPEVRSFWRAQRRIRTLPDRAVTACGRPALLTTFASVTGPGRLDVISDAEGYRLLRVETTDGR